MVQQDLTRVWWSVYKRQLCAGWEQGGIDSCQGDSGGPLVCEEKGNQVLNGIISTGFMCAIPRVPGLYTKISTYSDWIRKTVEDYPKIDVDSISKYSYRTPNGIIKPQGTLSTFKELRRQRFPDTLSLDTLSKLMSQ